MKHRIYKIFLIISISLLVNVFLFVLLPNLIHKTQGKSDLAPIIPINLVQIRHQKPPPPEEEKLPEKEPPKVIPTVRLQHNVSKRQDFEMEISLPSFEINPKLTLGMPVAPPPPGPTCFYDQAQVDQMPIPIFRTKPIYPYRAKQLNITGKVKVKFLVDENGQVSHIKILKSVPPGIFDKSVLTALPSWRFSPGKIKGKPVPTWVITTIKFEIS